MSVKLKYICTINPKTVTLADDLEVSFVPMPKVGEQGEFDPSEIRTYREVKKGFTNFQNGDVLFAKITPCMENGKGAVAKGLKNGYGFGSTEFHVLRPDYNKVTSEWLYYLTSWSEFRKEAEINMTGSAGQKRVPKTFLENYEVNLPDVQKQKEMADTMDQIGKLIALRKEQLAKLDQLVKSRFIELFGDPIDNPLNWKVSDFKDVVYFQEGPGVRNWQFRESGIKLINIRNLVDDKLVLGNTNNYLSVQEVEEKYKHFLLDIGDYVMASSGVTWGKIAEIFEEHLPLCLNTSIIRLRPYDESVISKKYLFHYIKGDAFRTQIKRLITGSAQPNFGPTHLKQISIMVPPVELQNQFVAFIEQTDKSKLAIQQSLDKLELLKKSLMQEYFG